MESLSTLFPTDNLYKFLAITGLVIAAFSIIYPMNKSLELARNIRRIEGEKKLIVNEAEILRKKGDIISNLLSDLESDYTSDSMALKQYQSDYNVEIVTTNAVDDFILKNKTLRSRSEREYYDFIFNHKADLDPRVNKLKEIRAANEKSIILSNELSIKSVKLENTADFLLLEDEIYNQVKLLGFLGFFFGTLISALGFVKWYVLLQKPQDELAKIQLRELKSKLGID